MAVKCVSRLALTTVPRVDHMAAQGRVSLTSQTDFSRSLTVSWLLEVDVGVAKRASGDNIAANTNRQNWTSRREFFE